MKSHLDYCDCAAPDCGVGIIHEPHCTSRIAAGILADVQREIDMFKVKLAANKNEIERLTNNLVKIRLNFRSLMDVAHAVDKGYAEEYRLTEAIKEARAILEE